MCFDYQGTFNHLTCADSEGGGRKGVPKSQVVIGILKNAGTDPPQEAIESPIAS